MPINTNASVTWKWIVGVLVPLIFLFGGIIVADNRAIVQKTQDKIEEVRKEKVDKNQYYRDIADIKDTLRGIDRKINEIQKDIR